MLSDEYSPVLKIDLAEINKKSIIDFREQYLSEADQKIIQQFRRASVNQSHLIQQFQGFKLPEIQNANGLMASLNPSQELMAELPTSLKAAKNLEKEEKERFQLTVEKYSFSSKVSGPRCNEELVYLLCNCLFG